MDAKFLDAADGDPHRAEHLRRAHFARLALRSDASTPVAAVLGLSLGAAVTTTHDIGANGSSRSSGQTGSVAELSTTFLRLASGSSALGLSDPGVPLMASAGRRDDASAEVPVPTAPVGFGL
jgi:hypothetical protein